MLGELVEVLGFGIEVVSDLFFPRRASERKAKRDGSNYMSVVQFEELPDSSRVWVFGSDQTLDEAKAKILMKEVDAFLHQWKAHGAELTVGRDWRYDRFLTVAVDQSTAGASGCSIDGLFRSLKSLEPKLGASLVNSGLIFYTDENGIVQSVKRERFGWLGAQGKVGPGTRVFDPTVTSLVEWRSRFALDLKDSWHAKLLKQNQPA